MTGQQRVPERLRLSRRKGYRKPEGAVVVARPSCWGNPWKVGSTGWTVLPGGVINREPHPPLTRAEAVESFRNSNSFDLDWVRIIREKLGGKDLLCWCPLPAPGEPDICHGAVLLELANTPQGEPE